MTDNPALFKLIHGVKDGIIERMEMDECDPYIIPDGFLTQEEIESLRGNTTLNFRYRARTLSRTFSPTTSDRRT